MSIIVKTELNFTTSACAASPSIDRRFHFICVISVQFHGSIAPARIRSAGAPASPCTTYAPGWHNRFQRGIERLDRGANGSPAPRPFAAVVRRLGTRTMPCVPKGMRRFIRTCARRHPVAEAACYRLREDTDEGSVHPISHSSVLELKQKTKWMSHRLLYVRMIADCRDTVGKGKVQIIPGPIIAGVVFQVSLQQRQRTVDERRTHRSVRAAERAVINDRRDL